MIRQEASRRWTSLTALPCINGPMRSAIRRSTMSHVSSVVEAEQFNLEVRQFLRRLTHNLPQP